MLCTCVLFQGVASAANLGAVVPSTIVLPVGGTWGDPNSPLITTAAAVNSGNNLGFGDGDSVVVQFDQAVSCVALTPGSTLSSFLQLHPPGLQVLVSNVTWSTNDTLTLTFWNVSTLRLAADDSVSVGRITVNVTGVLSANGKSPKGNCSAVVSIGSWGDAPNATLQDQSTAALRVAVAPPSTRVGYRVNRFLVQLVDSRDGNGTIDGNGTMAPVVDVPLFPLMATSAWSSLLASAGRNHSATLTVTSSTGIAASVPSMVYGGDGYVAVMVLDDGFDVPDGSTATFDVVGLLARHRYCVRVAVNNPYFGSDDSIGPLSVTVPTCLTPSPPIVTSVVGPVSALLCAGGQSITVVGSRLGVFGSVVVMTVANQRGMKFASTSCAVTTGMSSVA